MGYQQKPAAWELAAGRWDEVYRVLAPELDAAVAKASGPYVRKPRHVSCPVHGGEHGDAFRLRPDWLASGGGVCNTCGHFPNGILLLAWLKGWSKAEASKQVEEVLAGRPVEVERTIAPASTPKSGGDDAFRMKCIVEAWEQSVGLGHPDAEPARMYLDQRGLTPLEGPLATLRYHRGLGYWEGGRCVGRWPALLGLVQQPSGAPATIQRIYLTPEGRKAPVDEVKKMMPRPESISLTGAAVWLDPANGPILHYAEGIETALAVRNITGEPTWAAINATLLAGATPPTGVRAVCIWADRDPLTQAGISPGLHAAEKAVLAIRERGMRAVVFYPPAINDGHVDWNDIVAQFGAEDVRQWPAYRKMRAALVGRMAWLRRWKK